MIADVPEVAKAVALLLGVDHHHIRSSTKRIQAIVWPRQVAMYCCRLITGAGPSEIGLYFHRDHATVIHAVRVVERELRRNHRLAVLVEKARQCIHPNGRPS